MVTLMSALYSYKYLLLGLKICAKYNKLYAHSCQGHAAANTNSDC